MNTVECDKSEKHFNRNDELYIEKKYIENGEKNEKTEKNEKSDKSESDSKREKTRK